MRMFLVFALTASLLPGCGSGVKDSSAEPAVSGQGGILRFTSVATDRGLIFSHHPGKERRYYFPEIMCAGAAFFDSDGDNDLDVLLIDAREETEPAGIAGTRSSCRLFRQDDKRFLDVTESAGLTDHGYGMGVAAGDVNNDGRPDFYVTCVGADSLYLNLGENRFQNISEAAGIQNDRWSASACFVDFDRDGWLDLFVTNYVDYQPFAPCRDGSGRDDYCNPAIFPRTTDRLFRNVTANSSDGSPKFIDVSVAAGIAGRAGAGLGVLCGDFNGDFWPDLYVANDGHANFLWMNQRDGTFRDEAVLMGVANDVVGRGQGSMGLASGDLNADGLPDILVTNLEGENNAVYASVQGGVFTEISRELGLFGPSLPSTGFGVVLEDFDHDGDLDAAVANGRVRRPGDADQTASRSNGKTESGLDVFWNDYSERSQLFENAGSGGEFAEQAHPDDQFSRDLAVSRALVSGDFDNDGDIDLLSTQIAGPVRLYENQTASKGNWISIRVIDPALGGRDAYGSVVSVTADKSRVSRYANPASSYLSSCDPRVHFGIGGSDRVDRIDVIWPDGVAEEFPEALANQFLILKRGEGKRP